MSNLALKKRKFNIGVHHFHIDWSNTHERNLLYFNDKPCKWVDAEFLLTTPINEYWVDVFPDQVEALQSGLTFLGIKCTIQPIDYGKEPLMRVNIECRCDADLLEALIEEFLDIPLFYFVQPCD